MTETPLYPLSEFTPEEAAKVAEFEAAPTPPEVLREQLAMVLASHEPHYHHETESYICVPDGTDPAARIGCLWGSAPDLTDEETAREFRLHVADAALAVFRGQQDPAVQRVLALAGELDGLVDDETVDEVARVAHGWTLNRIRAALSVTP